VCPGVASWSSIYGELPAQEYPPLMRDETQEQLQPTTVATQDYRSLDSHDISDDNVEQAPNQTDDNVEQVHDKTERFWVIFSATVILSCSNSQSCMTQMPVMYFLRDDMKLSPDAISGYFGPAGLWQMLGSDIQILYGLIFDTMSLFGERRRPYGMLGMLGVALADVWLSLSYSEDMVAAALILQGICSIVCGLMGCVILCDYSHNMQLSVVESAALWVQPMFWNSIWSSVASLIGSGLVNVVSNRTSLCLCAVPQVIGLIFVLYAGKVERPLRIKRTVQEATREWCNSLKTYFANAAVYPIVLVALAMNVSPSVGMNNSGLGFEYYTDVIGVPKDILSWLPNIGNFSGAVGVLLGERLLKAMEFRTALYLVMMAGPLVQLSSALLFSGVTRHTVIGSTVWIVILNTVVGVLGASGGAASYISMNLFERFTPAGATTTVFAAFCSLWVGAATLSSLSRAWLAELMGVGEENSISAFAHLWSLCLVIAAIQGVWVQAMLILPKTSAKLNELSCAVRGTAVDAEIHAGAPTEAQDAEINAAYAYAKV